MKQLPFIHSVVGILSLVAFIASGQYMDLAYEHLDGMADGPRMLFRSVHIYLLFAALLNVALGLYMKPLDGGRARNLQLAGSVIVLVVPCLLLLSFFTESQASTLVRPIARAGVYLALAGMALHYAASLMSTKPQDR